MGGEGGLFVERAFPVSPLVLSNEFGLGYITWSYGPGFQEESLGDIGLEICDRLNVKAMPLLAKEPKSSFIIP